MIPTWTLAISIPAGILTGFILCLVVMVVIAVTRKEVPMAGATYHLDDLELDQFLHDINQPGDTT